MVGAGIVAKPLHLMFQVWDGTGGLVGRGREGVRLVMWQLRKRVLKFEVVLKFFFSNSNSFVILPSYFACSFYIIQVYTRLYVLNGKQGHHHHTHHHL